MAQLMDAKEAHEIYNAHKTDYDQRMLKNTEDKVYSIIDQAIKLPSFGILLECSIFPNLAIRRQIEDKLRSLGYNVDFKLNSTFVDWGSSSAEVDKAHRVFITAHAASTMCHNIMQQMLNEYRINKLNKIINKINKELTCGTNGREITTCIGEYHFEYFYDMLTKKNYTVDYNDTSDGRIQVYIKW